MPRPARPPRAWHSDHVDAETGDRREVDRELRPPGPHCPPSPPLGEVRRRYGGRPAAAGMRVPPLPRLRERATHGAGPVAGRPLRRRLPRREARRIGACRRIPDPPTRGPPSGRRTAGSVPCGRRNQRPIGENRPTRRQGGAEMPTRNASATWEGGLRGGKGSFRGESGAIDAGATRSARALATRAAPTPRSCWPRPRRPASAWRWPRGWRRRHARHARAHRRRLHRGEGGRGLQDHHHAPAVRAQVPGVDDATFQKAAQDTKKNCPVSKALAGVDIQLEATLES